MFEGLVSTILERFVGQYVENLDPKSLSISIWSGKVELNDLVLKKTAFDQFDIPVVVTQGFIGRMHLSIPWSNLSNAPVVVDVSDIYFVVSPKTNFPFSPEDERKKQQLIKTNMLASYDSAKANQMKQKEQEQPSSPKAKQDPSFTAKLIETIVNNVQVRIQDVHVRYEDLADPKKPVLFGATLRDLKIESTNKDWQPMFIKELQQFVYKTLELKGVSIYLNMQENNKPFSEIKNAAEFKKEMKNAGLDIKSKQYIIMPIDGSAKVTLQRDSSVLNLDLPKYQIDLQFDRFSIRLNDLQYRSLLRITEYLSSYKAAGEFVAMKPTADLLSNSNSLVRRQWIEYALKAAHASVRKQYFSWNQVVQRNLDKKKYIFLYKRNKKVPWHDKLDEYDLDALKGLESRLDYDTIVLFRELAEVELVEEEKKYQEKQKSKTKSWFFWGSSTTEEDKNAIKVTDEDRQKLYKTIGYSVTEEVQKNKLPPNYVQIRVNFLLKGGEIGLDDGASNSAIITAVYSDLKAQFLMKQDGFIFNLGLGVFELHDKFSKDTLYPSILCRRKESSVSKPLMDLSVVSDPTNEKSDIQVKLSFEEVNVFVVPPLIQRILSFFIIPVDVNLSAIQDLASQQLSNLQQQAQTQLKLALENKKVLDIDISINSPKFIVPENFKDSQSTIVVLDLGKLNIKSHANKTERQRRLQNLELHDDDYYDIFNFNLNNIQILITNYEHFSNTSYLEQTGINVLEKVTLIMNLGLCITPSNEDLPQTKISGSIPSIKINVSLDKVEKILKTMNKVLVLVDNPTGIIKSKDSVTQSGIVKVKGPIKSDSDQEWTDYWVELTRNSLNIFEKEADEKPLTSITLTKDVKIYDANEITPQSTDDQNIFMLEIPQTNDQVIKVSISSDNARRLIWVQNILTAINVYSLDVPSMRQIFAKTKMEEEQLSRKKVNVLLDIKLEQFAIRLNYKNKDIAEFRLNNFKVLMNLRNFDKTIRAELRSFAILDLLETNADKYILSSGLEASKNLVELTFVQSTQRSLFLDKHQKQTLISSKVGELVKESAMVVAFRIDSLDVFFDPIVLSKTVLFMYDLMNVFNKHAAKRTKTIAAMVKTTGVKSSDTPEAMRDSSFRLTAELESLSLVLVDFGSTFTTFSMTKTNVRMLTNNTGLTLDGSIGDLRAEDKSEDSLYPELVGLRDKKHTSIISFEYSQLNNIKSNSENIPFYNKFIKAKMDSVRIVFLMRLINKLQLYFSEGPLLEALKAGSQKATQYSLDVVKKQSESIELVKFNIELIHPLIIIPVSVDTNDKVVANLGRICVTNDLEMVKDTDTEKFAHQNWVEVFDIQVDSMKLKTIQKMRVYNVVENMDIKFFMKRAVLNKGNEIPNMFIKLNVPDLTLKLSHAQYQMVFQILDKNINDTSIPVTKPAAPINTETVPAVAAALTPANQTPNQHIAQFINVEIPSISLHLLRGEGKMDEKDALATLKLSGLSFTMENKYDLSSQMSVIIQQFSASDQRIESKSLFKQFVSMSEGIRQEVSSTVALTATSSIPQPFLKLMYKTKDGDTVIDAIVGSPRVIFVSEIIMQLKDFFMNMRPESPAQSKAETSISTSTSSSVDTGDVIISSNTYLGEDLVLSNKRKMYIKKNASKEVTLFGEGHFITLSESTDTQEPLIYVEEEMTFKAKNIKLKYSGDLQKYIHKERGAQIQAPSTQGVIHIHPEEQASIQSSTVEVKKTVEQEKKPELVKRMTVSATLGKPHVIFPEDATNVNSRLLVLAFGCKGKYEQDPQKENGQFEIQDLTCFVETQQGAKLKGAAIIEPITLSLALSSSTIQKQTIRNFLINISTDFRIRISYQDVKMILAIVNSFSNAKLAEMEHQKAVQDALAHDPLSNETLGIVPIEDDDEQSQKSDRADDKDSDEESNKTATDDDEFKDARDDVVLDVPVPVQQEVPIVQEIIKQEQLKPQPVSSDKTLENQPKDAYAEYNDDRALVANTQIVPAKPTQLAEPETVQFIQAVFDTKHNISVLIVDDIRGYDIPLIDLGIGNLNLQAELTLKALMQIEVTMQLDLSANFFNINLADWEPLIEPWRFTAVFQRAPNRSDTYIYKDVLTVTDTGNEGDPVLPLNINITKSMLETVLTTVQLWKEGLTSDKVLSVKYEPYTIRNHTGSLITYHREGKVETKVEVFPGKEIGFNFPENKARADMNSWKRELHIVVSVPDIDNHVVNVRRVGKIYMANKDNSRHCIVEVEQFEGRKIITVRSNMTLHNTTTIAWEFGISLKNHVKSFGILEPSATMGVPIFDQNGILVVRPVHNKMYHWSDAIPGFRIGEINKNPTTSRLFTCKPTEEYKKELSFHCVARTSEDTVKERLKHQHIVVMHKDLLIKLCPPLAIENLLGVPLECSVSDQKVSICKCTLQRGEKLYMYNANLRNTITMKALLVGNWQTSCAALLNSNETPPPHEPNKYIILYETSQNDKEQNSLYLLLDMLHGTGIAHREALIYCPFWIINRTGQKLAIKDNLYKIAGQDILNPPPDKKPEPLMFTFKDPIKSNKLSVSINDSQFSKPVNITTPGTVGELEIIKDKRYDLGLSISMAPGKFKRSKLVVFSARYVICNRTSNPIYYKQDKSAKVFPLDANSKVEFYWPEISASNPMLCITSNKSEFSFSSSFKVNVLSEMMLKCLSKTVDQEFDLLSVNIVQKDAALYIIITKPERPPYIINNELDADVKVRQLNSALDWIVPAKSKMPFAWDNAMATQLIQMEIVNTIVNSYNINKVTKRGQHDTIELKNLQKVNLQVRAKGTTRILDIAPVIHREEKQEEFMALRVDALLGAIGVSLVNSEKSLEVAYLYLDQVTLCFSKSNLKQYIHASLKHLQLDCQAYDTQFPVVVSSKRDPSKHFLRISMIQSLEEKNITLYEYFSVNMQDAAIKLNYSFVTQVLEFLDQLLKTTGAEDNQQVEQMLQASMEEPSQTVQGKDELFFELLELHPIKLNVTFKYNKIESDSQQQLQQQVGLSASSYVFQILDSIGVTFVNVDDAPLKFNALILEYPFLDKTALIDKIKQHYIRAATQQLYKILGSLDVIGNPVGLFSDLSTGVKDFFYEPASGITKSPEEFGSGILRGTSSLISKTKHGAFNSASKVSGTLSRGLKQFTFDTDYIKEGERSSAPKSTLEGLQEGSEALGKNLLDAATGIFTKPVQGANKEGALGFVKGFGVALISMPVKPVAGLFEFAQKTTEGISASSEDVVERVRPPRTFREDGALTLYNHMLAHGRLLLYEVSGGKHPNEQALFVCGGEANNSILVSTAAVMSIKKNALEWRVEFSQIDDYKKDPSGAIILEMKKTQTNIFGSTSVSTEKRKIAVADSKNAIDRLATDQLDQVLKAAISRVKKLPSLSTSTTTTSTPNPKKK